MGILKKIGLLAVWLVLSIELLFVLEGVTQMHTPGFLLADQIVPSGPRTPFGTGLLVGIATDFVLCFATVYALWFVFIWFLRHVEK